MLKQSDIMIDTWETHIYPRQFEYKGLGKLIYYNKYSYSGVVTLSLVSPHKVLLFV